MLPVPRDVTLPAMNEQISEILRLLRNLIRIGTVSAVNLDDGLCRVDTGNLTTG